MLCVCVHQCLPRLIKLQFLCPSAGRVCAVCFYFPNMRFITWRGKKHKRRRRRDALYV